MLILVLNKGDFEMKHKAMIMLLIAMLALPAGMTQARQETVTIEFWHAYSEESPENGMLVDTLIPMFEETHPNIEVESIPVPYDDFRQTMLTALAGGEGPDLARLDIIWSPEFAELGVLEPLDEVMSEFQDYADRVFPGPLSTNLYDGHYYGLPLDTNTRIFWWNPNMYEAAGIEGPPATIDDLAAQCDAIMALGEDTAVFSDGGTYGWAVLPWIWSFGGSITDPEITTASGYVNGEATVAAYEFLAEKIDSGCFSPSFLGGGLSTPDGFFTDVFASMLEGPWWFPLAEAQYPDFPIRTALMPAGDGGSISVVGGENIALFKGAETEAALEFLRFTQSDEYQLKMSEVGQLTVVAELIETDYFQNHPYYGTFLEQLETAKARTPHPKWTEMEGILTDAGQLILRGEMPAQDALDLAAEEIDALLAE
jgi:multiple sugar transport system substrate-binding protein